ncbi:phosphotransferase [Cupriavidus lacunae]|uniref:phosphotransferase n=1 Tax=Cupriavidus lacunae TaxID=2666307 RepID=UPI001ABFE17A|nr:phosphotransferase [Cupriavidus lacunae]
MTTELRLLEEVEQDDVLAVAVARPTLEHTRSFRIALSDGVVRRAALFDAASGRPLEMTREDVVQAGQALKRLHDQPALRDLAPRRQVADLAETYRTLDRLAQAFTFAGQAVAATRERCQQLVAAGWPSVEMPVGFCHGDFRMANMRIDGRQITLFDFDDCGSEPQS